VTTLDRYVVISADGHAGNEIHGYRDYLEKAFLDEFDAWVADYVCPFPDLEGPNASRNWDSDRRLADLEDDGIVAEVLFPNTVPPFYPKSSRYFGSRNSRYCAWLPPAWLSAVMTT